MRSQAGGLGVQCHPGARGAYSAPGLFPAAQTSGAADLRGGAQTLWEQTQWSVGLKLLLYKSGSQSDLKKFRLMIRNLVENDHLPDYRVTFDTETDKVTFINRGGLCDLKEARSWQGHLGPDDIDAARDKAGGWDIYMLEGNWRDWMVKNGINPKFPGAHFKSFCASWVENNGRSG